MRDVVRRLAMSRPDVAFTLAGEERAPVTWPAALPGAPGRLARLADILGRGVPRQRRRGAGRARGRHGRRLHRAADADAAPTRSGNICSSTAGRCATSCCSAWCAAPMPTICRATAIRSSRCSSRCRRARSTSTCIRPRPRCASATPALVRALLMHALKEGLARESSRAATDRRQRDHRRVPPGRTAPARQLRLAALVRTARLAGARRGRRMGQHRPGGLRRSRAGGLRRRRRRRDRARRSRRARARRCSTGRSAPRARRCTTPTSWRRPATAWSSSISTPRTSAWSTSA